MNLLSQTSYYVKRAGHAGASQLKNQYNYINELGAPYKERFPAVGDLLDYGDFVEYRMEAIPYRTKFRDCLLGNPKDSFKPCFELKQAVTVLENVLTFALGDLATSREHRVPSDYLQKTYWGKYERRLKETQDKINRLLRTKIECLDCGHWDYNHEDFYYLDWLNTAFQQEEIVINNKTYKNPSYILTKLQREHKVIAAITPTSLYHIHGDLHFDNILINPNDPNFSDYKLIDPAGFCEGADIAYDVGKLLHSCHGKYDFLHRMWFELAGLKMGESRGFNIKIWREERPIAVAEGGGGSGSPLYRKEPILTKAEHLLFDSIDNELLSILARIFQQYDGLRDDKTWECRSYLMEALHFCTMLPFHIEKSGKLAVALYCTGVQHLNEWCKNFAPQLIQSDSR